MAGNAVERLLDQLRKTQEKWTSAFKGWVDAANTIQGILQNIHQLPESTLPPAHIARERDRLEIVLRGAEKAEAVARMNLAHLEALERHAFEQLRWEGDQRLQRSTRNATWVAAGVAAVALLVSGWTIVREVVRAAQNPTEATQPAPQPLAPGPWRPDLLTHP
jgi:hypothetical protein